MAVLAVVLAATLVTVVPTPSSATPTPPPNKDCSGDAVIAKLSVVEDRAAANMLAVALQALSPSGTQRCLIDAGEACTTEYSGSWCYRADGGLYKCPGAGPCPSSSQRQQEQARQASRVFVVGGPAAIPDEFLRGLPPWTRIAGQTRWGTQAEVAAGILDLAAGINPTAYDPMKTSPGTLPPNTDCTGDATVTKLSVIEDRAAANMLAEALAELSGTSARCLVDAGDPSRLSPPPASAASDLGRAEKVYVVGGTAAVPDGWLRSCLGVTSAVRIAGADRWATQADVAKRIIALVRVGQRQAVTVPEASSLCEQPKPGPPRNLRLSTGNGNDLLMSWDPPENVDAVQVSHYRLKVTGGDSPALKRLSSWIDVEPTTGWLEIGVSCDASVRMNIQVLAVSMSGEQGEIAVLESGFPDSCRVPPTPNAPKNLRVSTHDYNRLRVHWDIPANAGASRVSSYQVKITGGDQSSLNTNSWRSVPGSKSTTTYEVSRVSCKSGVKLQIRVRAVTLDGRKGESSRLDTGFPASCRVPPKPGKPQNLRLTIQNQDDLRVSWKAPANAGDPDIDRYELKIAGGDTSGLRLNNYKSVGTRTSYTVPNVSCSRSVTLQVRVRAVSRQGKTGDAAVLESRFPSNCVPEERLRAPQGLRLSAENENDLKVSWSAPSNAGSRPRVDHYQIQITGGDKSELRMSGYRTVSGGSSGRSVLVRDVSCDQSVTLHVSVYAVSETGKQGEVARLQDRFPCTPEERLRAPQSLQVSIQDHDDLKISWSAPSNAGRRPALTKYQIQITGGDTSALRMNRWVDVRDGRPASSYTVRDISCDRDVTLQVSVRGVSSTGAEGEVARVQSGFPAECRPEEIGPWKYQETRTALEYYEAAVSGYAPYATDGFWHPVYSNRAQPRLRVGCLGVERMMGIYIHARDIFDGDLRPYVKIGDRAYSSDSVSLTDPLVEIWDVTEEGSNTNRGLISPPSNSSLPSVFGWSYSNPSGNPTFRVVYLTFFDGVDDDLKLTERYGFGRWSSSSIGSVFGALPCW